MYIYYYIVPVTILTSFNGVEHSCQVSRNDRDSPGIFAFVPVVSRLTQKADNVPDFSQTLSSRAHRWHLLSQQKTYKPGRSEESSFWHCFKY